MKTQPKEVTGSAALVYAIQAGLEIETACDPTKRDTIILRTKEPCSVTISAEDGIATVCVATATSKTVMTYDHMHCIALQ